MPATPVSSSPDIVSLSILGYANTCVGLFYLDISPSIYIGGDNTHVLGANFQITNPQGVIVKPFGSNYEIAPALSGGMDAAVSFAIPTISNGFQLGNYTLEVELFDRNGTRYTNSKTLKLCAPDSLKPTLKFANLSAKFQGNCQDGKMAVLVDGVPNYGGVVVQSQVNSFEMDYPTKSTLDPITGISITNFTVPLYEGVYNIEGTICATYNLGDSIFVSILYKVKGEHDQRCLIDLCCINDAFTALRAQRDSDCSDEEKAKTANIILDALFLIGNAKMAADCGEDPSDIIVELEKLLGCSCTCNCNEGTPIINNTPVADSSIVGCGFTKTTVGLTTQYNLDNYAYVVDITPNSGVLTITDATLAGCTQTQVITFNLGILYEQIKTTALTDPCAWAAIVRKCFVGLDLSCLGFTPQQTALLTFQEIIQALANAACSGGTCASKVTNIRVEQVGRFLNIKWDEDAFTDSVNIYANGILSANITAGVLTYDLPFDFSSQVVISIVPLCANGAAGSGDTITFSNVLRPTFIAPPQIYSPYLQNPCPYDITTNVQALPLGISVEFHTANNTDAASLVGDPTNALQGVYFVFGKDNDGFYSEGVQMQLVCDATGSCSMPQNLQVAPQVGGNLIKFQSAAYPPPMNSYTIKRRLSSDPDVPGSYITLGSPLWNASISRWVISDNSAVDNQLYTYRAISNCGTTAPYIDVEYASITCPTMALTPKVTEIDYSFFPIGGAVSKVEVTIYSDNGSTIVHTDTHLPAFPSMISGQFVYLDQNKTYWVGVKSFIGTYSKSCPLQQMTTLKANVTLTLDYIAGAFLLQLSDPLSLPLELKVGNVTGSADVCVTPLQTDLVGPNMLIPAGSLSATQQNDGLNYHSVYYRLANSAAFEVYGTKVSGNSFVVGGATVAFQILHTACSFYPA